MICKTCPYINNIKYENYMECYCNKLGCLIKNSEPCEKEVEYVKRNSRHPRKLNAYKRKVRYKQYLERLADEDQGYPSGAYRVGYDGFYTDNPNYTKYVKREWRGKRSKYLKRLSSRKIRRYKGEIPDGGSYKKIFDFWWELT